MAPTLLGDHERARCDACDLVWKVDASAMRQHADNMMCAHCGQSLQRLDPTRIAADVVAIRECNGETDEIQRGDLVAIKWDGRLRVKRIAALEGEKVDLDQLRLTVGGERLEDLLTSASSSVELPRFLVDDDGRRPVSRWSSIDADSPPPRSSSAWQRIPGGGWKWGEAFASPWLVYHHQSVHDQNRAAPVGDDYPFNVGLDRPLYTVDRLDLRGEIRSSSAAQLEIAFWSDRGNVRTVITSNGERSFAVSYHDADPADGLPVTAERPIAVRVQGQPATLSGLLIHRLIEYRIRRRDSREQYPLRIGDGHCFVVGDNVPVSVDSREVGPIPTTSIIGVVTGTQR